MFTYTRLSVLLLLAASFALTGCNQLAGFADARHFVAGASPIALAVADFNGDGNFDIVTANSSQDEVALLLGDGAGDFSIQDVFSVGDGILDLTVADLNKNGHMDVITGNSGSITLLFGNGNGTFQQANNIFAAGTFAQIITGDFNNDGNLDLAAVSSIPLFGGVAVRLGDGAGAFGQTNFVGNPNTPVSLAAGDFNGDGNLDIITANLATDNVSVYLGNGAGGLGNAINTSTGANTRPNAVGVGDFDGDGILDAAVANLQTGNITVLFGEGDGNFRQGGTPAQLSGAAKLKVADVDGDGHLDIVTANPLSDDVTILYGRGDGTFAFQFRLEVGEHPLGIAVADVNGDGLNDLVTANRDSGDVSVLLGQN